MTAVVLTTMTRINSHVSWDELGLRAREQRSPQGRVRSGKLV